jgi:hypothetical protein
VDLEEELEQIPVGQDVRVIDDLHHLGMISEVVVGGGSGYRRPSTRLGSR